MNSNPASFLNLFFDDLQAFFTSPNALRNILILITATIVAYIASKYLARMIIFIAQRVAVRSDTASNEETLVRLRQVETYLSVAVAGVRAVVVGVVAYVTLTIVAPSATTGAAAIGAGTFFVVFAGQTLGILLRDVTVGASMIIEQWFHVGDFVKIEPFMDVSGVVEQFTLRSTKLRSLNGEVIWVHNQHVQAAHITPRGVRTLAVDVFVHDLELGKKTLTRLMKAVPSSPMMLAKPLRITASEKWGEDLWRLTVTGQTAPGREWLIEKFFVETIIDVDSEAADRAQRVFAYAPIARYADPVADKKFKRAIRASKGE
jgi:moderate conductance mechanosensitive channel